jgi:glutamate-5-semialdehyde dehydrogenase
LASLPLETRNGALESIATALVERSQTIEEANARDMRAAKDQGLPQALVKRLRYDRAKIDESVESIRSLKAQEDVVGKLLSRTELDEGLVLDKVSCPIGVIPIHRDRTGRYPATPLL